jgi:cytochrome P450
MRKSMGAPLLPGKLREHEAWIEQAAEALVADLCDRRNFDGIRDLARCLPLTVVTELVGLPEDGRENMLLWAASSFDILGIQNERGRAGIERIKEMREWIATSATSERLRPGSWTARIMELRDSGQIPVDMAPQLIRDYINPSLDTTISATGELLLQLARTPDQWARIRSNPALIPRAVEEAVRLASPIRSFSRALACDYRLGEIDMPAGSRVLMVFASANRDERHFPNPNLFDVERKQRDHVGFGHGIHMCVGMHLARMEMRALLKAMVPRFVSLQAEDPVVALNNTIRTYASLPMQVNVS